MDYKKVLNCNIKNLDSLYLVHGSDDYQIEKFIEKFIETHCSGEFKDFNLDQLTEDDNSVSQLFNSIETLH